MSRERVVLIGLAVLVVGALLFAGAAAGQRSAWMEGYMMGRLTAVTAAPAAGAVAPAAAMLPYAPYGMGFAHRGPGVGGILLLVLGVGAVALMVGRCAHRARWRAWMAAQAPQGGDWLHGPPPWMQGPWAQGPWTQGVGPAGGPGTGKPADQPEPARPAAEPPAAER
jgi:hypothetical protein